VNNVPAVLEDVLASFCPPSSQRIGPPLPDNGNPLHAFDRRSDYARRDRFADVINGSARDFWHGFKGPLSARYDCEQEVAIFDAVAFACKLPCASDAERWQVVMRAIRELALEYSEKETK
jgi:hypothetical protein